jgi:hypothetical protein
MRHEVAAFGSADQATDRGLPFIEVLLGLWQIHDVVSSVLERNELAAVGEGDRVLEWSFPAGCFTRSDARAS